ncbi:MAG: hypothetical protein HQL64_00015 [Magnetococcales bacterium]|nr:hypothetical protein [Magnetococcales bacterium]
MTRQVPIQATDYPALATFCSSFPGEKLTHDLWQRRFQFWWEENPAFRPDWVRGWLLVNDSGIVGMLADIPSRIQLFGQEVTASNISPLLILPEYQQEGVRLLALFLAGARARPVFNTTASPGLAAVLRGFRFRNLAEYFVEHLFVTNTSFLAWKLNQKKNLPRVLAFPVAWSTRLVQQVRDWSGLSKIKGLQVRILDNAGPEFDRLWQRTDRNFGFTNRRTSLDLQWILCKNPLHRLLLCGCFTDDGVLIGYGLFVHFPVENPAGTVYLVCLDLWSEWTTVIPYVALIRKAIHFSKQNHLAMVIVPQYHEIIGCAANLSGFSVRRISSTAIYCRFPRGVTLGIDSEESRLSGYFGDAAL